MREHDILYMCAISVPKIHECRLFGFFCAIFGFDKDVHECFLEKNA